MFGTCCNKLKSCTDCRNFNVEIADLSAHHQCQGGYSVCLGEVWGKELTFSYFQDEEIKSIKSIKTKQSDEQDTRLFIDAIRAIVLHNISKNRGDLIPPIIDKYAASCSSYLPTQVDDNRF